MIYDLILSIRSQTGVIGLFIVPQKSIPMKLNVQIPSPLAVHFFQPKMIEQKELNSLLRLAAVERYDSS